MDAKQAVMGGVAAVVLAGAGWMVYRSQAVETLPEARKRLAAEIQAQRVAEVKAAPAPPKRLTITRTPTPSGPPPAPTFAFHPNYGKLTPLEGAALTGAPAERTDAPAAGKEPPVNGSDTAYSVSASTLQLEGPQGIVKAIRIAPDQKRFAAAGSDLKIRIWDLPAGKLQRTISGPMKTVMALAWSADGKRIAAGQRGGMIQVFDTATGKPVMDLQGHTEGINGLEYLKDGRLVSAGCDGAFRVWGPKGEVLVNEGMYPSCMLGLAVDPLGKTALVGGAEGGAHLVDIGTGKVITAIPNVHQQVWSTSFAEDGKLAVVYQAKGPVIVYDIAAGKQIKERTLGAYPQQVRMTAGGKMAAIGYGGAVTLWEPGADKVIASLRGPETTVWALDVSQDGRYVLAAGGGDASEPGTRVGADSRVHLFDMKAGKTVVAGGAVGGKVFAVDPAFHIGVMGGAGGKLSLFDPRTQQGTGELAAHEGAVVSAAFSADGKQLLTAGDDKLLKVWDVATKQEVGEIALPGAPAAAVWTGKEEVVAAVGTQLLAYQVGSGGEGRLVGKSAGGTLKFLLASADGTKLLASSAGGPVAVFATAGGAPVVLDRPTNEPLSAVYLSEDGAHAVTFDAGYGLVFFETQEGKHFEQMRQDAPKTVYALAAGPQPGEVAVYSHERGLMVFHAATGRMLAHEKHDERPGMAVAYERGGSLVVMAGEGGELRKEEMAVGQLMPWAGSRESLSITPDGKRAATQRPGGTAVDGSYVAVWDLATGALVMQAATGHKLVYDGPTAFSPDGRSVAAASLTHAMVLDTTTGKVTGQATAEKGAFKVIGMSPDGVTLAGSMVTNNGYGEQGDGEITLYDLSTGKEKRKLPRIGAPLQKIVWSPDGKRVVAVTKARDSQPQWASEEHGFYLMDAETGTLVHKFVTPGRDPAQAMYSADGKLLSLIDTVGMWQVLDASTFEPVHLRKMGHARLIAGMSEDGTVAFAGNFETPVMVWDAVKGVERTYPAHLLEYGALPFVRDGVPMVITVNGTSAMVDAYVPTEGK